MTKRPDLPWMPILEIPSTEVFFKVPAEHAYILYYLCRRVVKREDFTAYADEVWSAIFNNGNPPQS